MLASLKYIVIWFLGWVILTNICNHTMNTICWEGSFTRNSYHFYSRLCLILEFYIEYTLYNSRYNRGLCNVSHKPPYIKKITDKKG